MDETYRQKLDELQREYGLVLPQAYADFLLAHEGDGEFVLGDQVWMLASLLPAGWGGMQPLTLDSDFSLDRLPPVPFFRALGMFIQTIGDRFPKIVAFDGEIFPLDRLHAAICIGEDSLDILFLDAINQGVYAFYHDDLSIEKIADSFSDFMEQAE